MKKYLAGCLLLATMVLCLSGCYISDKKIAEYEKLDYNVVWEQADGVLRKKGLARNHVYYEIAGVPNRAYIALKDYEFYGIGDFADVPTVLVHRELGRAYTLDTCSAKLILMGGITDQTDWEQLGQQLRKQVLAEIEVELAEQIVQAILAEQSDNEKQEVYRNDVSHVYSYEMDRYAYQMKYYLGIQFSLAEYEGLTWMASIGCYEKDGETHYVMIAKKPNDARERMYIPCNAELSALIKQVSEEYDLIDFLHMDNYYNVLAFDYAQHLQAYPEGTPGVRCEGFVHPSYANVRSALAAVECAKNECTVPWDSVQVFFDGNARVWLVELSVQGVDGGGQSIYIHRDGDVLMIVDHE